MNDSIQEFFGEPIYTYTEKQAIEDGVLMKNPSEVFDECDIITTNLWGYIKEKSIEAKLTEPIELLGIVLEKAKKIFTKEKFRGDNDKNFFVIKNGQLKPVW